MEWKGPWRQCSVVLVAGRVVLVLEVDMALRIEGVV